MEYNKFYGVAWKALAGVAGGYIGHRSDRGSGSNYGMYMGAALGLGAATLGPRALKGLTSKGSSAYRAGKDAFQAGRLTGEMMGKGSAGVRAANFIGRNTRADTLLQALKTPTAIGAGVGTAYGAYKGDDYSLTRMAGYGLAGAGIGKWGYPAGKDLLFGFRNPGLQGFGPMSRSLRAGQETRKWLQGSPNDILDATLYTGNLAGQAGSSFLGKAKISPAAQRALIGGGIGAAWGAYRGDDYSAWRIGSRAAMGAGLGYLGANRIANDYSSLAYDLRTGIGRAGRAGNGITPRAQKVADWTAKTFLA